MKNLLSSQGPLLFVLTAQIVHNLLKWPMKESHGFLFTQGYNNNNNSNNESYLSVSPAWTARSAGHHIHTHTHAWHTRTWAGSLFFSSPRATILLLLIMIAI